MKSCIHILAILMAFSNSAHALEFIVGRVTTLEPTNMPSQITFSLNTGNATCPAGVWLKWVSANPENSKAVYATLATALAAGKQVRFYFNNGDTNCIGAYVHILDS